MSARRLLSLIASLFLLAGCGNDSAEDADALLAPWSGTWQAVGPLFHDETFDEVVQAIQDLRPEYSADEIEALSGDYSSLRFVRAFRIHPPMESLAGVPCGVSLPVIGIPMSLVTDRQRSCS